MDTVAHLSEQLLQQTRLIKELTERGETHLLLRALKRRSVLLHRLTECFGESSSEERDALRSLMQQILEEDSTIRSKMETLSQSIRTQCNKHHQQHRLITAYRPPTTPLLPGLHI